MKPFFLYRDNETVAQRVDRYPEPPRAVTTVNMHTMGWGGTIEVYASLALDPEENDWFVVHEQIIVGSELKRQNFMINLVGCFIWMKAVVKPSGGRGHVDRVTAI